MKKALQKMFRKNNSLRLKNKIVPVILSLLLVVSALSPLFASNAYAQNFPVLSGITYLNMPEKTFGGKTTPCKLTVTNFNLNKNKFSMSGILSYSGMNYPLNIEGTLYKSRIGKNNFVALARDKTNTFDVLHFSILFNPNIHFLVTKKMKNFVSQFNQKENGTLTNKFLPVITVYLKRKNTREISFVEGKLDKLSCIYKVSNSRFDIIAPISAETYLYLIFKPIWSNVNFSKQISTSYGNSIDTSNAIFYRRFYNYNSNQYTVYEIDVSAQELWTGNRASVETKLSITSATTTILDGNTLKPLYSWNGTPYTLGSYSQPVQTNVAAKYGNAFTDVYWYGTYETKPYVTIKLDVGLHINVLFFSVGVDISPNTTYFTQEHRYFAPGHNQLPWGSGKWTRKINVPFLYTCLKADSNAISQYYELKYTNYIEGGSGDVDAEWIVPVFYYQYPGSFHYDQTLTLYNSMRG